MKTILNKTILFLAIGLCFASACSRSGGELEKRIPASAEVFVSLNVRDIVENADCAIEDNEIFISQDFLAMLENFGVDEDDIMDIQDYTSGFVYDRFVFAMYKKYVCFGAVIADQEVVKKNLRRIFEDKPEKVGDFLVYSSSERDFDMVIVGNQLWVCESVDSLKSMFEAAASADITTTVGYKALDPGKTFVMMADVSYPAREVGLPASAACAWLDLDGSSLTGEAFLINDEGDRVPFGDILADIDTDFLNSVPADANYVIALGNVVDPRLRGLMNMAATSFGSVGFLVRELNGTAAFAINLPVEKFMGIDPTDESQVLEVVKTMSATLLLPYSPEVTDRVKGLLLSEFNLRDDAVLPDGSVKLPIEDITEIYVNQSGKYMRASTEQIVGSSAKSLKSVFSGCKAAIYSSFTHTPETEEYGVDYDTRLSFSMTSDALVLDSKLSKGKILANIIRSYASPKFRELLNKIQEDQLSTIRDVDSLEIIYDEPDNLESYY